jgi:hypothetical protein
MVRGSFGMVRLHHAEAAARQILHFDFQSTNVSLQHLNISRKRTMQK